MRTPNIQQQVRARDGYKCTGCGLTNQENIEKHGVQLDVHRLVPGSEYDLDGCITVCKACLTKQPVGAPGRPKVFREPRCIMQTRISAELKDALVSLAEQSHRALGNELILAIENHLKASGRLPSPPPV